MLLALGYYLIAVVISGALGLILVKGGNVYDEYEHVNEMPDEKEGKQ